MTKNTKKEVKTPYKVILKLNNREYKSQGDTLLDALNALEVDQYRTSGLLIVKKGNLTAERKFNTIFKLKRLLSNKVLRIIVAKNLELMMK